MPFTATTCTHHLKAQVLLMVEPQWLDAFQKSRSHCGLHSTEFQSAVGHKWALGDMNQRWTATELYIERVGTYFPSSTPCPRESIFLVASNRSQYEQQWWFIDRLITIITISSMAALLLLWFSGLLKIVAYVGIVGCSLGCLLIITISSSSAYHVAHKWIAKVCPNQNNYV